MCKIGAEKTRGALSVWLRALCELAASSARSAGGLWPVVRGLFSKMMKWDFVLFTLNHGTG